MPAKSEGARELLALDVKEVSLVDKAANKRKFLTVKRMESDEMPAKKDVKKDAAPETTDVADPKGSLSEDVNKAAMTLLKAIATERLESIQETLQKLIGGVGVLEKRDVNDNFGALWGMLSDAQRDVVAVSKSLGIDIDTKAPVEAKTEPATSSESLPLSEDQTQSVRATVAWLEKGGKGEPPADLVEAAGLLSALLSVPSLNTDKDNTMVQQEVEKAKRMTKARLDKLRGTLGELDSLLKEFEPEDGAADVAADTKGEDTAKAKAPPFGKKPAKGEEEEEDKKKAKTDSKDAKGEGVKKDDAATDDVDVKVAKAVEVAMAPVHELVALLKKQATEDVKKDEGEELADPTEVNKVFADIKKRLDAIEGVPSGGASNATDTVKKSEGGLWSGVI